MDFCSYATIMPMAVRLRVKELATEKGWNLATFQLEARLGMTTARRLWHSTSDGNPGGPPLRRLDFDSLERLCSIFHVTPDKVIEIIQDETKEEGKE